VSADAGAVAGERPLQEGRPATRDATGRINASPAARKLAAELGIDLATVEATGPNGRITSDDVERAAAQHVDTGPVESVVPAGDDHSLFVLQAGPRTGTPLVFLHGLGGSQSTWQLVLGDLATKYRVMAFDLPGHGRSGKPAPATVDYSIEGLAAAVAAALESLNAKPAIIVGHSLGGAVAISIALQHPERVKGLVLVDSVGLGREISPELLYLMSGAGDRDTAKHLLSLFYEDQRLVTDRGVDEMAQYLMMAGAWESQQAIAGSAFADSQQQSGLETRLSELKVPALIAWGELDRVIPASHAFAAVSALPDSLLKVITGVGHVPQVERSKVLSLAIQRFAKSLGE
jgi:pyruvate dehydrogenase E2 component (dihydrolipoyllysine-residue acetyltransferase)